MRNLLSSTLLALSLCAAPLGAATVADQLNEQAAANDQAAAAGDMHAAGTEVQAGHQEQSAITTNKQALQDDQIAAHRDDQAIHSDSVAVHNDTQALHHDQANLVAAEAHGNSAAETSDESKIASAEHGIAASSAARQSAQVHEADDHIGEHNAEHSIDVERAQRNRDYTDAGWDAAHAQGAERAATRADNAVGHDEGLGDAEHRDDRSLEREDGAAWRNGRADFHVAQAGRQQRIANIHQANGQHRLYGSFQRRQQATGHEHAAERRLRRS